MSADFLSSDAKFPAAIHTRPLTVWLCHLVEQYVPRSLTLDTNRPHLFLPQCWTTTNTIAGFDSVISTLKKRSTNKQLEVLCKTPVKEPEKDGPKFLIDHEMHFHRLLKKKNPGGRAPSKDELDAYVSSPIIDFSGEKLLDKNDRMTSTVISSTFRRSLKSVGPDPSDVDSVYKVRKEVINDDGDPEVTYDTVVINGWTMSLEGKLGQKDIAQTLHGSTQISVSRGFC